MTEELLAWIEKVETGATSLPLRIRLSRGCIRSLRVQGEIAPVRSGAEYWFAPMEIGAVAMLPGSGFGRSADKYDTNGGDGCNLSPCKLW
jgi:hypothetical protein